MMRQTCSYLLLSLGVVLCCSSCRRDQHYIDQYQSDYSDIIGKEIVFGSQLIELNRNRVVVERGKTSENRILKVIEADCAACIIDFKEWDHFLREHDLGRSVEMVFVVFGDRSVIEELDYYINSENRFGFHILLDTTHLFLVRNGIQSYHKQSLFLDKGNRVIMVGDPLNNEAILRYYEKIATASTGSEKK